MVKQILKKIALWGGVDIKLYNKNRAAYSKLFTKYQHCTMVSKELFIDNLELCAKFKNIEGDFVECGVWRGGMSAAISELLGSKCNLHLFDSFEGLPPAKEIDGREALAWQKDILAPGYYDNCTADESFTKEAMKLAGHDNYTLYKGWFQDTLSGINTKSIAILRLDGDWYDSVKVCLKELFPLLAEGGVVIIDDYYTWDGCAKAVHDYLSEIKSPSRIHQWNNKVAYIVKKN